VRTFILVVWLSFISLCFADEVDDEIRQLSVITEQFPPLNYEQNGQLTGSSSEILKLMYQQLKIEMPEIEVLPWTRAYKLAQSSDAVLLYTLSRTVAREDMFQWVGHTHSSRTIVVTYAGSGVTSFDPTVDELDRIVAVRSDASFYALDEHQYPEDKIDLVDSIVDQYRMLLEQRVKLASVSEASFLKILETEAYKDFKYETLFVLKQNQGYFGFSKSVDKRVIERMQNALDSIHQEHLVILQKYGLSY